MPNVSGWIDNQIKVMWSLQDSSYRENAQQWKNSGIIEGWHGDGNFARTTIMYCLLKTQGIRTTSWRDDIIIGAVKNKNDLYISISLDEDWEGKIVFDPQRHKTVMNLPFDWPRINQFPEWYTIKPDQKYSLKNVQTNSVTEYKGSELIKGISVKITPNSINKFVVAPL